MTVVQTFTHQSRISVFLRAIDCSQSSNVKSVFFIVLTMKRRRKKDEASVNFLFRQNGHAEMCQSIIYSNKKRY